MERQEQRERQEDYMRREKETRGKAEDQHQDKGKNCAMYQSDTAALAIITYLP